MTIKLTGLITRILPIEQRGNFKKREFHILTDEKKEYGFQLFYNDCFILNDYNVKDTVQVIGKIQTRNWSGRKITNLVAEKITMVDDTGTKEHHKTKKAIQEMKRNGTQPIQYRK
jgi:hypothetical protein